MFSLLYWFAILCKPQRTVYNRIALSKQILYFTKSLFLQYQMSIYTTTKRRQQLLHQLPTRVKTTHHRNLLKLIRKLAGNFPVHNHSNYIIFQSIVPTFKSHIMYIFTGRIRRMGKVMFSHVSFCLFTSPPGQATQQSVCLLRSRRGLSCWVKIGVFPDWNLKVGVGEKHIDCCDKVYGLFVYPKDMQDNYTKLTGIDFWEGSPTEG